MLAIGHAGAQWWFDAIFLSGLVAAALGLGLYVATRRAYLTELHDRAERLERERDQQGEIAAAAERARIAREMHDIVAHHLTVMITLSDAAVAASAKSPERAAEVMRSVSATGRQALADTRRLLGVLRGLRREWRPRPSRRSPTWPSSTRSSSRSGPRAWTPRWRCTGEAPPEVPAGVQLTVYRLVQEALTNTLKHGGAGARAHVRLRYAPGRAARRHRRRRRGRRCGRDHGRRPPAGQRPDRHAGARRAPTAATCRRARASRRAGRSSARLHLDGGDVA